MTLVAPHLWDHSVILALRETRQTILSWLPIELCYCLHYMSIPPPPPMPLAYETVYPRCGIFATRDGIPRWYVNRRTHDALVSRFHQYERYFDITSKPPHWRIKINCESHSTSRQKCGGGREDCIFELQFLAMCCSFCGNLSTLLFAVHTRDMSLPPRAVASATKRGLLMYACGACGPRYASNSNNVDISRLMLPRWEREDEDITTNYAIEIRPNDDYVITRVA